MTPEALAAVHARVFTHPRPWTAPEFADLLASPHVFVIGTPRAFALGRVIVDEAELLTIATDPAHQRTGLARTTLAAFHATAATRGATTAFLEVAADNVPARALYSAAGYGQTGLRRGYYRSQGGETVDALLLSRTLP